MNDWVYSVVGGVCITRAEIVIRRHGMAGPEDRQHVTWLLEQVVECLARLGCPA